AANPEGSSQAKPEATLASGVVVGAEWCPPVVRVEVWVAQSANQKSKGKEMAGPSVLALGKKKVAELAKRALGSESQVALSLKELVLVSPMMVEELILVIWESAGLKADGNHVFFDERLGEVEQAVEVTPVWDTDLVRQQANIGLRGIGGHECKVDGVVEGEWVEVAKCKRWCGAYIGKGGSAGLSSCCR
ncbi:uncharacterized protein VP01_1734g3, partial [Puccinia sorghi]